MLKIKSYVKVNSLAEAYELNQKKTARILGGMVWMKWATEQYPQRLIFPVWGWMRFRRMMTNLSSDV